MDFYRRMIVTFDSRENRDKLRAIAADLGTDEQTLINRMANNLVGFLEELRKQIKEVVEF